MTFANTKKQVKFLEEFLPGYIFINVAFRLWSIPIFSHRVFHVKRYNIHARARCYIHELRFFKYRDLISKKIVLNCVANVLGLGT